MTYTWNTVLEEEPKAGDSPRYGDDKVRRNSIAVRERFAPEHLIYTSGAFDTNADHGLHRQGSAVSFCQASAPTLRPDGTALGNDSKSIGRIWVDSSNDRLHYWNGTAWTLAKALSASSAGALSTLTVNNAAYVVLDNDGYDVIFLTGTMTADRTITLPTLSANQNRRIQFVDLSTHGAGPTQWTIDGEGSEKINGTLVWTMASYGERLTLVGTSTTWAVSEALGTYRNANSASAATQALPSVDTWYNLGGSMTLQAGVWEITYSAQVRAGSVPAEYFITFSTGAGSQSHVQYTTFISADGSHRPMGKTFRVIIVTTATFYLNVKSNSGGALALDVRGDLGGTVFEARRVA